MEKTSPRSPSLTPPLVPPPFSLLGPSPSQARAMSETARATHEVGLAVCYAPEKLQCVFGELRDRFGWSDADIIKIYQVKDGNCDLKTAEGTTISFQMDRSNHGIWRCREKEDFVLLDNCSNLFACAHAREVVKNALTYKLLSPFPL